MVQGASEGPLDHRGCSQLPAQLVITVTSPTQLEIVSAH